MSVQPKSCFIEAKRSMPKFAKSARQSVAKAPDSLKRAERTGQFRLQPAAAIVIEFGLCKMGIFAGVAGDFRRLSPSDCRLRSPETKSNAPKAGISGPLSRSESLTERRNGWLGRREGSNLRMAESKSAALPLGYSPNFSAIFPKGKCL